MRGIGSQPTSAFEQIVSMFIGGIYIRRSRQYLAPFMDARRIEILRDAQAVLFAINSTASAINVISNAPRPGKLCAID
jgi:outer membrane receptor protein involved in Fe transport